MVPALAAQVALQSRQCLCCCRFGIYAGGKCVAPGKVGGGLGAFDVYAAEIVHKTLAAMDAEGHSIDVYEIEAVHAIFVAVQDVAGRKIFVEFRKISSLSDLMDVPGRCAVKFTYNGKSHWVGVENCNVAFNSLENSVCVNKGKPTDARIISLG